MMECWIKHRLGAFTLDVRWSIEVGRTLAFLGPSGSGKTATLRAIAGLATPDEGHVEIDGTTLFDSAQRIDVAPHERRVGLLTQSFGLFPHLTVGQNVAFGLRRRRSEEATRRVGELMSILQIQELKERYPHQISAGQQQRVAVARAMAPRPKLLLLDEPFAALDQDLRRDLRQELREVRSREKITIVLVTHDIADALSLSDKVTVLERGRVAAEGSPLDVLRRPGAETVSRMTGVENIFEGVITASSRSEGVTTCDLGGIHMEVPYTPAAIGSRVRIGIRAGDVILAAKKPGGLSARNTLPGLVRSIARKGFELEAIVDCGRELRVEVTPRAVQNLGIIPGKNIWLVIKTNSCFLIE